MKLSSLVLSPALSSVCSTMATLSSAPGQAFASLGAAIEAAVAGDTVMLAPGEYEGAFELALDKLTVRAAGESGGKVVVRAAGNSPVIHATGNGIFVVGLELQQGCAGSATDCVAVTKGSAVFRKCGFKSENGSGLVVSGAKVSVDECTIEGTGKYGCLIEDKAVVDASSCAIQSCKAAGVVSRGKGSRFKGDLCTIQDNGELLAHARMSAHSQDACRVLPLLLLSMCRSCD